MKIDEVVVGEQYGWARYVSPPDRQVHVEALAVEQRLVTGGGRRARRERQVQVRIVDEATVHTPLWSNEPDAPPEWVAARELRPWSECAERWAIRKEGELWADRVRDALDTRGVGSVEGTMRVEQKLGDVHVTLDPAAAEYLWSMLRVGG